MTYEPAKRSRIKNAMETVLMMRIFLRYGQPSNRLLIPDFGKARSIRFLLAFALSSGICRAESASRPLPKKKEIPLTGEGYCAGLEEVKKRTKQDAAFELGQLCNGTQPTELLRKLIANPYTGNGTPRIIEIQVGPSSPGFVRFNVAFSMKVKKSAVELLRGEEAMLRDPSYAKGDGNKDMNVQYAVLDPDLEKPLLLEDDSDTAFLISQRDIRASGQRQFDDTSIHLLKLYRMNPDNYDFLTSITSLTKPTGLFNKSIVIRASMTDPDNPSGGISFTLMNVEVSDQSNNDAKVETIFAGYISRDIQAVFRYHSLKK